MVTNTYTVAGMTCGACIAEVMERVRTLPGVSGVAVAFSGGSGAPLFIESRHGVAPEVLHEVLDSTGFRVSATSKRLARHLRLKYASAA